MKTYLFSICIAAIVISLCEFIMPQGRMKNAVWMVISVLFAITMIKPILNLNLEETFDIDKYIYYDEQSVTVGYFDDKSEEYFSEYYKAALLENDLVTEKVEVEISRMNIEKIIVYLSNLVIEENNELINNTVIREYVASALGVEPEKVVVYV